MNVGECVITDKLCKYVTIYSVTKAAALMGINHSG